MQLSDRTIRRMLGNGWIGIEPRPLDECFQPATVDLRLGNLAGMAFPFPHVLHPNDFILGCTVEEISLPRNVAAQVKGKSTWARRGLLVECAGFIDPGFHGQITLEIKNLHDTNDILLREDERICQIAFFRVDTICDRLYGDPGLNSHYQGQQGTTYAHRND